LSHIKLDQLKMTVQDGMMNSKNACLPLDPPMMMISPVLAKGAETSAAIWGKA